MSEWYPDDAALLALEEDARTGVEYIPTGQSPYYLHFRKLIQRLLLACGRANDLRVYQDGQLTVGVRPGRCLIQQATVDFAGQTALAVSDDQTTRIWIDNTGTIQTDDSSFPSDRTTYLPLAEVVASSGQISQINDRRGEVLFGVMSPGLIGLTATVDEINQALDGISATVDPMRLNLLTGGPGSNADLCHHHRQLTLSEDAQVDFKVQNSNSGSAANAAVCLALPNVFQHNAVLKRDLDTGWLAQEVNGQAYALVGTVQVQRVHEGELTDSQTAAPIGAVPMDGQVVDVIISAGQNIESDTSADGLTATVKNNGTAICTTDPTLTDAAGAGFRCTDQGDGTAAVLKSDGAEQVVRGDLLTVDLTRSVSGNVTQQFTDVAVLVVIRADQPI
jgi:hypothetical protein